MAENDQGQSMTPRQVVHQFFLETDGGTILNDPDQGFLSELTQQFFDELTKHGLVIVPIQETPMMLAACNPQDESDRSILRGMWALMVKASQ
jgi:hypothetical protein